LTTVVSVLAGQPH